MGYQLECHDAVPSRTAAGGSTTASVQAAVRCESDPATGAVTPSLRQLADAPPIPCFDLFEARLGGFEFVVEQPHRIEDFAKGRRRSCAVTLAERENAVVAQESHDPWI